MMKLDTEIEKRIAESKKKPFYKERNRFYYAITNDYTLGTELAGFKLINSSELHEKFKLDEEDVLLEDERCNSGYYALIHADLPKKLQPEKDSKNIFVIDAYDLLLRYRDLFSFFIEKNDMYYYRMFDYIGEDSIIKTYEKEQSSFYYDKELTLYWFIIFAFLEDNERYSQIFIHLVKLNWDVAIGAKAYFEQKQHKQINNYEEKSRFLNSKI